MTRQTKHCLFPVLCAVLSVCGAAAALTMDEALAAMPPDNAEAAIAIFDQLLDGNPNVIASLADQVIAAEPGADAQARFALHGLACHVGRPDRDLQRLRLARLYEAALNRATHSEARRFFMSLLRLCGDDATLFVLAAFVCDPDVTEDAAQSIAAIGGPAAREVLEKLRCEEVPQADAAIQHALAMLNQLPTLDAAATGLNEELLAVLFWRSGEALNSQGAAALCREALKREDVPPQHRAMILHALARIDQKDALPELVEAVRSTEPRCWGMALELAGGMADVEVSRTFAFRLQEFPPERRPQVIAMLGRRGDPIARRAAAAAFADPDVEVRLAAYEAVTQRASSSDSGANNRPSRAKSTKMRSAEEYFLKELTEAMKKADSEREVQGIKEAMLRVPNWDLSSRDFEEMELAPPQKAAYLQIIAERQCWTLRPVVDAWLLDGDPRVRREACAAVAAIGSEGDMDALYQRLLEEERDAEADAARGAIVALANKLGGTAVEAAVVKGRTRLESAADKAAVRLIKTLGALSGATALEGVLAVANRSLTDETPDVVAATAALETLGLWPGTESMAHLLDLLDRTEKTEQRALTVKQAVVAAQRAHKDDDKQREALAAIQEHCREEAESQIVLEAINKLTPPENK